MTIADTYEIDPVLVRNDAGAALLWIEKHDRGLTVVDTNASVAELIYRDDSNEDAEVFTAEWKAAVS